MEYLYISGISFFATLILVYLLRPVALKMRLVDKPNHRKVHHQPVPVIGGIVVFIASVLTLGITHGFSIFTTEVEVIFFGCSAMLIMGIIDDRVNLRATVKLMAQISLAYYAFENGFNIESMYGVFGIYELPRFVQYVLTLTVITGTVNAFNLMDGIDGLAAGMAIVGCFAFTFLAFLTGNVFLIYVYLAVAGALTGFLIFNFHQDKKVFMGDAGSLFLGYLLVVSAISILQDANQTPNITVVLATIVGVLALPVIDSLRVYKRRISKGYSPFRADKTHLHHLVLFLGLKHKFSSLIIIGVSVLIIIISIIFQSVIGITYTLQMILIFFILITTLLNIHRSIKFWKKRITKLERSED